ncbi:MAG: anti-sigma B factor antagonist [Patiriisocius sp.]|jgi:anti-sigma B factor antagonist
MNCNFRDNQILVMNFKIENKDNYSIVASKLEKLDAQVAPDLKSELVYLNKNGVKSIIIDLSETRYCDSSGLSALLIANRMCKEQNGTFVLTGLNDPVKKLIVISQLDSVLNITHTLSEAEDLLMMEELGKNL